MISDCAQHRRNETKFYVLCPVNHSYLQRGLRCTSAAARLLRLWVRIPTGTWMSVCCECCVVSGRGLCDELITRTEESYRLWCVVVCNLETSWMRRPWPTPGCCAKRKNHSHRNLVRYIQLSLFISSIITLFPFGWPSTEKVMCIFIFHREKGFSDHVRPLNQATFCYKQSFVGPIRLLFSNFILRVIPIRRRENFWGENNFHALRKLIFSDHFYWNKYSEEYETKTWHSLKRTPIFMYGHDWSA